MQSQLLNIRSAISDVRKINFFFKGGTLFFRPPDFWVNFPDPPTPPPPKKIQQQQQTNKQTKTRRKNTCFFGSCMRTRLPAIKLQVDIFDCFQTTFRVIFGDDKRKAVLIRGLETPFRDAERRVRLSPLFWCRIKVSKQLSGWFLQMINAKLFWLGG